ncbi:DUF2784 domain-containing protein [Azospira restricta]|uniref:DUF2784 domain-containing protein n=1 Tax=Azospira restricta TaxID=404405 RepID=A0A974SPL9_9RHOO|nr:DUF2784 domain-containing protein [Azospira restricta]QRJ64156.1 DUF2784 domain-containing protein [Azospira restricta]
MYALLADLVVAIHFAFIVFAVAGGLLVLRWPWLAWVHVPAALWGAAVVACGWVCPLTPLENWLRVAAGEAGYAGGFIERYLLPLIYPPGLTRELQMLLGLALLLLNAAIYLWLWRRRR